MKISFIIPTLNEESVLEKLLLKLKEINSFEFETIVSDGKSADRTVDIAEKLADKLVVYSGASRQTIGHARNAGARQARGEYLIFLDADVYIPNPNQFFQKTFEIFEKRPKLAALGVYLRVLPNLETWADKLCFGGMNRLFYFYNSILKLGAGAGDFQMVKAKSFRKVNGYNEILVGAEDMDLFYRLSKMGQTRVEPSLVVFHTGRRAHQVGWPKLLSQWIINGVYLILFKRSHSKEWKVIR